jgi:hypothetical protein
MPLVLGKILFYFSPTLAIPSNVLIETAISFLSDTDDSSLGYRYEQ